MAAVIRNSILKRIAAGLAAVPKYGESGDAYFKQALRGRLQQLVGKPAVLIFRDEWTTKFHGEANVRETMRVLLGVFIDTQLPVDELESELEIAIATVQAFMEGDSELRKLVHQIIPLGGTESWIQESMPDANTVLVFDIEYDRKRGNP